MTADAKHPVDPSKLLTVIITTSPTPSAPSAELISAVFDSFLAQCPILIACRLVVVFDHYDHIVTQPRLKKGQVSSEQAEAYSEYKQNVKELVADTYFTDLSRQSLEWASTQVEAESGSPLDKHNKNSVTVDVTSSKDALITYVEPHRRLGFGLAVRTALRIADTSYVWVHQHDWTLEVPVQIAPMLEVMEMTKDDELAPVRYICLPSCRMLEYAISDHVTRYPKLNALTRTLQRDFRTSSNETVPLTPLYFWHDKPHIVNREHYLTTVFPTRLAISRGEFIEDSIGQRARNQMKEGQWAKWACWLLYPPVLEKPFVRHIRGRTWRGSEATRVLVEQQKQERRQRGWKKREKRARLAALIDSVDKINISSEDS